ncbi:MAG TPA: transglycosylase SLT domain-containing protein [Bryobacteraceae bacterium]|nr:transglycosylase SLT domain-containing protein [Bryobacteraceae bacterium]
MGWIRYWIALMAAGVGLAQTVNRVPAPAGTAPADPSIPQVKPVNVPPPGALSRPPPAGKEPSAVEQQRAAMARQREAVRKQAEAVGVWMVPAREIGNRHASVTPAPSDSTAEDGQVPPAAGCDPIGEDSVAPIIDGAAKEQSVHPKLLRAVIEQESGFRPCAVSPKGAKGLMQLMPDTAAELGVNDPFDPKENVEAGARYLRQLLERYKGDLKQALGAYNAGPATVDQAGGIPNIRETRDYVQAILDKVGSIPIDMTSIQTAKPFQE